MTSSNKGTHPDGWNDPPANLSLSDNISTKRILLNKRVPYTNQDLSVTNNPSNILTTPPPCASSTIVSTSIRNSDDEITSKNDLLTIDEINEIFQRQIEKLEKSSSSIEKKIFDDIQKKFQIMKDEWTQDKLSINTKEILTNIFRQLNSNHIQQAFDMHVTLVRNASSEVVRFIVGIKRLIQELQRLSD